MGMNGREYRAIPPWGPVPACPGGKDWDALMRLALEQARAAADMGEVPVGALVIDAHGSILSRAHNETRTLCDPTAHAEVLATRRAAERLGNYRLGGCVLVVTLEPCLMCAGAIREARLDGVVYGAADSRAGAILSCTEGLTYTGEEASPWSYGGVGAAACAQLLTEFFRSRRT